jgi:hypothetical protein
MYELKKMERYLRVNLLGPGPSSYKKRIYRAAVSQRLRNTAIERGLSKCDLETSTVRRPRPTRDVEPSI